MFTWWCWFVPHCCYCYSWPMTVTLWSHVVICFCCQSQSLQSDCQWKTQFKIDLGFKNFCSFRIWLSLWLRLWLWLCLREDLWLAVQWHYVPIYIFLLLLFWFCFYFQWQCTTTSCSPNDADLFLSVVIVILHQWFLFWNCDMFCCQSQSLQSDCQWKTRFKVSLRFKHSATYGYVQQSTKKNDCCWNLLKFIMFLLLECMFLG